MSASSIWAVVPVKRFAVAKRRLRSLLSRDERAWLARLMLEDVLDALHPCETLAGVVVVTRDQAVGAIAASRGVPVLDDRGLDINGAIGAARAFLLERGATGMIVAPSDVPLLPPPLIEQLAAILRHPPAVALVPASRDGGTNLLALSPIDAIAPAFGPDSFARHRAAARAAGFTAAVLACARAGLDIDRPADLAAFLAAPSATRSHAYLAALGVEARLEPNRPGEHSRQIARA